MPQVQAPRYRPEIAAEEMGSAAVVGEEPAQERVVEERLGEDVGDEVGVGVGGLADHQGGRLLGAHDARFSTSRLTDSVAGPQVAREGSANSQAAVMPTLQTLPTEGAIWWAAPPLAISRSLPAPLAPPTPSRP